ncbi:unnamed protein product [Macrosiphum euphorbiae]|uniref:Uncharacterized protein n=1 Tax=Macrosiphum euphorbiae TaxID=13131 RepID=A0AAV0XI31_9HEMI|nr:unnamed protein product [Macrosiphum euphorbiae]
MDLVEANIRVSGNAEGQLTTRFFSMPNIDVMTPSLEIQAPHDTAVVQTEFETLTEPYVAMPAVVNAGQQDKVVITENTVKPRRRSL